MVNNVVVGVILTQVKGNCFEKLRKEDATEII